jgi:hypothetical protein
VTSLVILVHVAATLAMAGVIWSVQLVQYPLFAEVESSQFPRYHEAHVRRIGFVVVPAMLIEAITGVALFWLLPVTPSLLLASTLLGTVWMSTFLLQVPIHRELSVSWSATSIRKLVRGNWIRTSSWTARAAILVVATPHWLSQ